MLLAIDTASRWMSIALYDGQHVIAEQSQLSRNQHTTQLSPMIETVLRYSETTARDLTAVTIAQGPGSYSGLRVGFGAAKGLAMGCRIPLIGVPTLDIIAAATPHFEGDLIAVVQAGRKRIIADRYTWHQTRWMAQGTPEIMLWSELLGTLEQPTLINGEIDDAGRQQINEFDHLHMLESAWQLRRAGFLAMLAWQKFQDNAFEADPNPIYLKEPG